MWGAMSVKYVSIKNALLHSNDPEDKANKKDGLTSNAVSWVERGGNFNIFETY